MKVLAMQAEWRKIIFVNYRIDKEVLDPWLPPGTEYDLYQGECFISLAGFLFLHTHFALIPFPFHQAFEEFNLRFYVVRKEKNDDRRGVVFIREFVRKPVFKWLANTFAREKYECYSMRSEIRHDAHQLSAQYSFHAGDRWNTLTATAAPGVQLIERGSLTEFIAEHYYGYNKLGRDLSLEYRLHHPRWAAYPLRTVDVDCDFRSFYPPQFVPYLSGEPHSVQVIEGSPVALSPNRIIRGRQ